MKLNHLFLLMPVVVSCGSEDKTDTKPMPQDPHSFARADEAIITHLDLDITVDFDHTIISGTATYDIENKAGVDSIVLDTRQLTIESITADGEATAFHLGQYDSILGQPLIVSIGKKTNQISIRYRTSPEAAALQWLTPAQTAGKQQPFLFTQSQAILARTWIPVQDGPGIRFTYDATVRVPPDLMAVMSASNPTARSGEGIYTFKMPQRIPAYLMALAVGDIAFKPVGDRTGVYAEPSVLDASHYEFGDMEKMLIAAEELYGTYRWGRYDVIVLPPSFPFGGMENPRLTFATPTVIAGDRSNTSLIAHELAHSWSGNLVTNATWNDFWLNEGFTVYFEMRIMEKLYGRSYSEMLAYLSYQDVVKEIDEFIKEGRGADTRLKTDLAGRDPDMGLNTVPYIKGYLLLRLMEETVSREKFDAFLREYFDAHAFGIMTTEEFEKYANEHLLNDTTAKLIDMPAWIYKEGLPANSPKPHSDKFRKVEEEVRAWQGGKPLDQLDTAGWVSHQWRHFLETLPTSLEEWQMIDLDSRFHFSQAGNNEILSKWLELAIRHNYKQAYPRLEQFLVSVGRRKYLQPLYEALVETEQKDFALEVYAKARPNYHSVSYRTIDRILGWE